LLPIALSLVLAFSSKEARTNDWVDIELYNPEKELYWSPPLINTTWVTSPYGFRNDGFHQGIDIGLQIGTYIFATFDGVIKESRYDYGYGNYIIIAHDNGLETLYGHLEGRVKAGARVKAGQFIGFGGNTGWSSGSHLHFEVRYKGYPINPADIFDFHKSKSQIRYQWLRIHGANLKQEKNISRR
jgi:murein DD-endopeptidase MepM/ murein hydrolase activator NlpD